LCPWSRTDHRVDQQLGPQVAPDVPARFDLDLQVAQQLEPGRRGEGGLDADVAAEAADLAGADRGRAHGHDADVDVRRRDGQAAQRFEGKLLDAMAVLQEQYRGRRPQVRGQSAQRRFQVHDLDRDNQQRVVQGEIDLLARIQGYRFGEQTVDPQPMLPYGPDMGAAAD
jgi:hypothetical protein